MSSYFFHLTLELYSTPAASSNPPTNPQLLLTKSSSNSAPTSARAFVPATGTAIFKTTLPAHKSSKWTTYSFTKRSAFPDRTEASFHSPQRLSPESDRKDSHGDALLLPEKNLSLKSNIPSPPKARTRTKHSNEAAASDWRYDQVEIESIDMEKSKTSSTSGGLHTKGVYLPSDPKTTEVGWGIVHLYRDTEETGDANRIQRTSQHQGVGGHDSDIAKFSVDDCTTLCILAVPSWMMPSDLLGFVGDQAREDVSHFRLIRTGRANKYMVLLKFRSAKKARDWQKAYNGRLFSAAEPENCHVVFIRSVEFLSPENDVNATNFPNNNHDPFTATANGESTSMLARPLAPPPPNLLELPTCPVCLERMDETTGLLTILCQHVFHCACLEKWRGSGCPVCRYTHSPSYTFPYPRPGPGEEEEIEPMCSACAGTNNLWICLICGNIGCGRYDDAHAYAHYEQTSHCYAMDVNTQHVWDYAGDGYVHRLIQSKPPPTPAARDESSHANGGLMDIPVRRRHENEAYRAEGGDVVPREKMENMATEYTYLLTSQLEGQRRYFEEQVERAVDKATEASQRAEAAAVSASKAQSELASAQSATSEMAAKLERIEKALEKSDKTRSKFEQMARDMSSQLREEKVMNEGLVKRIKAAEATASEAKVAMEKAVAEKKDLEEMNHDLTMFISSQEKVKELQAAGEEVEDGHAYAPESASKGKKGKGRKK